jgi:hypothetical protein
MESVGRITARIHLKYIWATHLLVALFCGWSGGSLLAQPKVSIKTTPSTDSLVALETLTGLVKSVPAQLIPLTVRVRNLSTQRVSALMIKAAVLRYDGYTESRWVLRHNFDNVSHSLAPSQEYLVTPYGLEAERFLRGGVTSSSTEESLRELLSTLPEWKEVTFSVDSILDTSGKFVGPDEAGCYRMFTDWLRADRDLSRAIRRLQDEGRPGSIVEALSSVKANGTSTFATRDHYGRRWEQYARVLERQLRTSGYEAVFREAARLGASAETRLVFR